MTDLINPVTIIPKDLEYLKNKINDTAYHDYSQSPSKYTYMRIMSGPGIDGEPEDFGPHGVAVRGALDPDNIYVYDVMINGVLWKGVKLRDMYNKFLKGEL